MFNTKSLHILSQQIAVRLPKLSNMFAVQCELAAAGNTRAPHPSAIYVHSIKTKSHIKNDMSCTLEQTQETSRDVTWALEAHQSPCCEKIHNMCSLSFFVLSFLCMLHIFSYHFHVSNNARVGTIYY